MDTELRKIISCAKNFEDKDKLFLYAILIGVKQEAGNDILKQIEIKPKFYTRPHIMQSKTKI